MIELKDVLHYIDNAITDNKNKTHYISYIEIIHDYFLDLEGINFEIRYDILKQCNLIITKLIDHKNGMLRDDWFKIRKLIVQNMIEGDEVNDCDKYFKITSS